MGVKSCSACTHNTHSRLWAAARRRAVGSGAWGADEEEGGWAVEQAARGGAWRALGSADAVREAAAVLTGSTGTGTMPAGQASAIRQWVPGSQAARFGRVRISTECTGLCGLVKTDLAMTDEGRRRRRKHQRRCCTDSQLAGRAWTVTLTLSAAQGCSSGSCPGHCFTSTSSLSSFSGLPPAQLFLKRKVAFTKVSSGLSPGCSIAGGGGGSGGGGRGMRSSNARRWAGGDTSELSVKHRSCFLHPRPVHLALT